MIQITHLFEYLGTSTIYDLCGINGITLGTRNLSYSTRLGRPGDENSSSYRLVATQL
jgi:hypothetical protein